MSIEAYKLAWDYGLTGSYLLIALCLAEHHNSRTGQCNPSYNTIANRVGLSRRQVIRLIADMEVDGYISVISMPDQSNQYVLNASVMKKLVTPATLPGDVDVTGVVTPATLPGDIDVTGVVTSDVTQTVFKPEYNQERENGLKIVVNHFKGLGIAFTGATLAGIEMGLARYPPEQIIRALEKTNQRGNVGSWWPYAEKILQNWERCPEEFNRETRTSGYANGNAVGRPATAERGIQFRPAFEGDRPSGISIG